MQINKKLKRTVVVNVGFGWILEEKINKEYLEDFIFPILPSIVNALLQLS